MYKKTVIICCSSHNLLPKFFSFKKSFDIIYEYSSRRHMSGAVGEHLFSVCFELKLSIVIYDKHSRVTLQDSCMTAI